MVDADMRAAPLLCMHSGSILLAARVFVPGICNDPRMVAESAGSMLPISLTARLDRPLFVFHIPLACDRFCSYGKISSSERLAGDLSCCVDCAGRHSGESDRNTISALARQARSSDAMECRLL